MKSKVRLDQCKMGMRRLEESEMSFAKDNEVVKRLTATC